VALQQPPFAPLTNKQAQKQGNMLESAKHLLCWIKEMHLPYWIKKQEKFLSASSSKKIHNSRTYGIDQNELGLLCHGISTGSTTGGKRVTGTNTFFQIAYEDIPHHKRNQIIYTKVVCEI
jgi:hypothetical protein